MRYVLLALLAGCFTTRSSTPEWTWPDGELERDAILCAAAEVYGARYADKLAEVPVRTFVDYPFAGLNYGGIIGLSAEARTARASAWSHEAVHWLEHEKDPRHRWTEYPQCKVSPFVDAELRFVTALHACRLREEGYEQ